MRKSVDQRKTFISVNTNLWYININQKWNESAHWWKRGTPYRVLSVPHTLIFNEFWPSKTHFITKHFAQTKRTFTDQRKRPLTPKTTPRIKPDSRFRDNKILQNCSSQERPLFLQGHFSLAERVVLLLCQFMVPRQFSKWQLEFTDRFESNSWIYFYIVLKKNWKIYWSEQSFTGFGRDDRCSSWGLGTLFPCRRGDLTIQELL